MSENISGKVVVITGASSGIGESTARLLAAQGAKVVLAARRKDRLDALVREIREAGGTAEAFSCDVSKQAEVEALVQGAIASFGQVDVLVNNAGLMPLAPMAKRRVDEWEQMIDINIKGVLYGIYAALPHFQERKSGHFINISSVAGHVVFLGAAVYCATKFAVRVISEGLRMEIGPDVRVTNISPGAVATELLDSVKDQETRAQIEQVAKDAIPAESIARAIAYAIAQPADVDVNEMVIRPTAQQL